MISNCCNSNVSAHILCFCPRLRTDCDFRGDFNWWERVRFTHHKRDQKAQFFMSVMVQKLNNGNIFAGNLAICGVCVCVMTVSSLRPQPLSRFFIIFK